MPAMQRPASVTVAGLLCLGSALYAFLAPRFGLELYEFPVPAWLAITAALVHVYLGLGLWAGDNLARVLTLWTLGLGFFGSWVAMYLAIEGGTGSFEIYAGGVIKVLVTAFFLWHLSGAAAVAFTGGSPTAHGRGHDHHAHA
jgi:hypothetical protein